MLGATANIKRRNQHEKFNGILQKGHPMQVGQNVTEPASGLNYFLSKQSAESIHGVSHNSAHVVRMTTTGFPQNTQQNLTRNKH